MQSRNWTPPLVLKNFGFLIILPFLSFVADCTSSAHLVYSTQQLRSNQFCMDSSAAKAICWFFKHVLIVFFSWCSVIWIIIWISNSMLCKIPWNKNPAMEHFGMSAVPWLKPRSEMSQSLSQNYKTMCGLLMLPCWGLKDLPISLIVCLCARGISLYGGYWGSVFTILHPSPLYILVHTCRHT